SLLAAFRPGSLRLAAGPSSAATDETDTLGGSTVAVDEQEGAPAPPLDESVAPAAAGVTSPAPSARARTRSAVQRWYVPVTVSLIIVLLGVLARRQLAIVATVRPPRDSLLVLEHDPRGQTTLRAAAIGTNTTGVLDAADRATLGPSWVDSIATPWSDPLVS